MNRAVFDELRDDCTNYEIAAGLSDGEKSAVWSEARAERPTELALLCDYRALRNHEGA